MHPGSTPHYCGQTAWAADQAVTDFHALSGRRAPPGPPPWAPKYPTLSQVPTVSTSLIRSRSSEIPTPLIHRPTAALRRRRRHRSPALPPAHIPPAGPPRARRGGRRARQPMSVTLSVMPLSPAARGGAAVAAGVSAAAAAAAAVSAVSSLQPAWRSAAGPVQGPPHPPPGVSLRSQQLKLRSLEEGARG